MARLIHMFGNKLDARYTGLLSCFFIAGAMSFFMSFSMTLIAYGVNWSFIISWLSAWSTSFVIGFPAAIVVVPLVRKFVSSITAQPNLIKNANAHCINTINEAPVVDS